MTYPSSRTGARLWHTRINTLIKSYGNNLHEAPMNQRKLYVFSRHLQYLQKIDKTISWERYSRSNFEYTTNYLKVLVNRPDLARGSTFIARLRLNAWWSETRAAQAQLIPYCYLNRCTTCGNRVLTDHTTHYLIDCSGHYQARESSQLAAIIHRVRQQFGTALTSADLSILLLLEVSAV